MSTSYCLKKYLPENKQVKLKVSGREDSLLKCWGHLHQFGLGKKNSLDLFTALKDWDIFFKTSFSSCSNETPIDFHQIWWDYFFNCPQMKKSDKQVSRNSMVQFLCP